MCKHEWRKKMDYCQNKSKENLIRRIKKKIRKFNVIDKVYTKN